MRGGKPSLLEKAANPKAIFFSYGHDKNRELVEMFKRDLERRDHKIWQDVDRIRPWSEWRAEITEGIRTSGMAIAFLSPHSTRYPGVCLNEIAMALHRFGIVHPIMVERVDHGDIPYTISNIQWHDLTDWRAKKESNPDDFKRFYEEKLLQIIDHIEGEATRFATEIDILKKVLDPRSFDSKFEEHIDGFVGREWVFDAYHNWLDAQPVSRVFWVKAGPGFGKTALSVNLAHRFRGSVIATWFCDNQADKNPAHSLTTLGYQMATRWSDYRAKLLARLGLFEGASDAEVERVRKSLAGKTLHDLFSEIISEPLAGLISRENKLVILIDALDEATDERRANPLAELISGKFIGLSEWISFVVTSRPEEEVVGYLQRFKPFELTAGEDNNTADLAQFCREKIGSMKTLAGMSSGEREKLCDRLVEKSEGMILYIRMVADGLREGILDVGDLEKMEGGLGGLYSQYYQAFSTKFRHDFRESIQPFLRLVLAAPEPLPMDLAKDILGKEKAVEVRSRLGSYLEGSTLGMRLFHKTLVEWLESDQSGEFCTDAEDGAVRIGEFLLQTFADWKDGDGKESLRHRR